MHPDLDPIIAAVLTATLMFNPEQLAVLQYAVFELEVADGWRNAQSNRRDHLQTTARLAVIPEVKAIIGSARFQASEEKK